MPPAPVSGLRALVINDANRRASVSTKPKRTLPTGSASGVTSFRRRGGGALIEGSIRLGYPADLRNRGDH
jgi:hypothetical protein